MPYKFIEYSTQTQSYLPQCKIFEHSRFTPANKLAASHCYVLVFVCSGIIICLYDSMIKVNQ